MGSDCGYIIDMKSEILKLRVSPEEKQGFKEAAHLAGIPVSTWMRERLRLAAIREMEGAGLPIPFIQKIPLKVKKNA